jgi:hypothetical protein
MDSPLVTNLFRQLFSHRASRCLAQGTRPALAAARAPQISHRGKATRATNPTASSSTSKPSRLPDVDAKRESKWQPRRNAFPHERMEEFERYPMVTADILRGRRERPRRVKMLLRDFIEGVEGCIGNTPLIKIKSLSEATGCEILAKAEVRGSSAVLARCGTNFYMT